jgi:lipoate-protein ligase A
MTQIQKYFPLNLYGFESSSVSLSMALDEILFEETEQTGTGFLRLSVFNPQSKTLGYFQTSRNRDLQDSSWTRRMSGGGIVEHQGDLILSLSHSLLHLLPKGGSRNLTSLLYRQIHDAVRQSLSLATGNSNLSLMEECKPSSACGVFVQSNESYCFNSPVQYDICAPILSSTASTFSQSKIVGGALCRKRKSFLYQGSLQVSELVSNTKMRDTFQKYLEKALESIWEVSFEERPFSMEQKIEAEALAKSKYLSAAWKGKY